MAYRYAKSGTFEDQRRALVSDNGQKVEPRNVTMYPDQWAVVDSFAKDYGYGSTSAGLRRIVDEWTVFKGAQVEMDLGTGEKNRAIT